MQASRSLVILIDNQRSEKPREGLEVHIKRSIRPLTITGYKIESERNFTLILGGFRRELVPLQFETEVRISAVEKIKVYITRIINSKETDLIKNPSM